VNPQDKYPKTPQRLTNIFFSNPLYFVTFCSYRRRQILNNSTVFSAFVSFSTEGLSLHNVAVGRFMIMPDHVHLFVRGNKEFKLGVWVQSLKSALTRRLLDTGLNRPLWQRGFFDHILRSSESYTEKWNYVFMNPVRRGYVKNPDDWPYTGEIIRIDRV